MATLAAAEAAQQKLSVMLSGIEGVTGLGVSVIDDGFGVRVYLEGPAADDQVPDTMDGVPIVTRVTGQVQAHSQL